jgi:hypothetical protein
MAPADGAARRSRGAAQRRQRLELAFMLCCPLLCAVLPLAALALLAARHASSSAAAVAYPSCVDALAATRQPYVRPFGAPSDHGRPGLSHVTLHGAVHHGAQEARVCGCHLCSCRCL